MTHWSVDLAVYQQLHCSVTDMTHCSVDLAVYTVQLRTYRDTLVSRLSCLSAVTLFSYGHTETHWSVDLAVYQQLHCSVTDMTHWSVDLAVYQQLHCSVTDMTHCSVDLAVYTVQLRTYRDTLVSRLSCLSAVTLFSYGHTETHWSVDLAVYQQLHCSVTDIQRHTGQST